MVGKNRPEQKKKKKKKNTARKLKVFTEKKQQQKKVKTLQHFLKFSDISCTVSMNRKMCFWIHCLYIFFFFQLKKKSKWNENLFGVNT